MRAICLQHGDRKEFMSAPIRQYQVQTTGASLRVRESGNTQATSTVILIHGGPGLTGYMGALGELISDRYRVIDYDQRGAFESPSSGPFRLQDHVDDLKDLIQETCAGVKPILLGHSWGGIVGLGFCARFADEVAKLVIVGSGTLDQIGFEKHMANVGGRLSYPEFVTLQQLFRNLGDDTLSEDERRKYDLQALHLVFPVYQYDRTSIAQTPILPRNIGPAYETDADYRAKRARGELLKLLEDVRTPVAAIHGDSDVICHEAVFPILKKHLPQEPETFLIENSGHMPWVERNAKTHFVPALNRLLKI